MTVRKKSDTSLEPTSLESTVAELKKRNGFIQAILDNLPIGLAVNEFDSGRATYMNRRFSSIYGWPEETLTNIPSFFEHVYPDPEYRERITSRIMADINSGDPRRMQWEDIRITTSSGEERIVEAVNIPITEQNIMVSTVRDVTDQKKLEQSLNLNVEQKELLMRELQHRVKNSLSIVSSLLSLEADKFSDAEYQRSISGAQARVRSIAMVYEQLYRNDKIDQVALDTHIEQLSRMVVETFSAKAEEVDLLLDLAGVEIDTRYAVSVGLILNELLTNALKYAYPVGQIGHIAVVLEVDGDWATLRVTDHGVGFNHSHDSDRTDTIGLSLVHTLAEQIGGYVKIDTSSGTTVSVTFPFAG